MSTTATDTWKYTNSEKMQKARENWAGTDNGVTRKAKELEGQRSYASRCTCIHERSDELLTDGITIFFVQAVSETNLGRAHGLFA